MQLKKSIKNFGGSQVVFSESSLLGHMQIVLRVDFRSLEPDDHFRWFTALFHNCTNAIEISLCFYSIVYVFLCAVCVLDR